MYRKTICINYDYLCHCQVEAPNAALKSCNAVLDLQPKNVKALFRKGKVSKPLGSKSSVSFGTSEPTLISKHNIHHQK